MPPRIEFNLENLENLCKLHPTIDEIATFFGCVRNTIFNRMKEEPEFKEAMQRGFDQGKMAIRRWQMQAAEKGNTSMLIFLGKNLLGQKDVVEQKIDQHVTRTITLMPPREWERPQLSAPAAVSEAIEGDFSRQEIRPNGSNH